jgi:hypothetical protein
MTKCLHCKREFSLKDVERETAGASFPKTRDNVILFIL